MGELVSGPTAIHDSASNGRIQVEDLIESYHPSRAGEPVNLPGARAPVASDRDPAVETPTR